MGRTVRSSLVCPLAVPTSAIDNARPVSANLRVEFKIFLPLGEKKRMRRKRGCEQISFGELFLENAVTGGRVEELSKMTVRVQVSAQVTDMSRYLRSTRHFPASGLRRPYQELTLTSATISHSAVEYLLVSAADRTSPNSSPLMLRP